jgi:hypothetical protein
MSYKEGHKSGWGKNRRKNEGTTQNVYENKGGKKVKRVKIAHRPECL